MSPPATEYAVSVAGAEIAFPCGSDETVLDAAERAGLALPYSCRSGVCLSCVAELVSGQALVRRQGLVEGPAQARLCQARPCSDIQIAPRRVARREAAPRRTLEARVHRVLRPAPDVTVLKLRFANGVRARFRAGQYVRVKLPDGGWRDYSIANPPHANDGVELHVRRLSGGRFSEAVLAPGDRLALELAYGECVLDAASSRPVILAVTGTGFAPAKAIVEDLARRGFERPAHLYWGGRDRADLYMADAMTALAAKHDRFRFAPVLSQPDARWEGRVGYVQQAALQDHPDMAAFDAYACGSPAMVAGAKADFVAAGLDPARFYCDPFTASGESAA